MSSNGPAASTPSRRNARSEGFRSWPIFVFDGSAKNGAIEERGEGAGEGTAVSYTFNGGARQTITGTTVDFSSDSIKLNPNDESADLIFGDALPICKIGDQPFSTLKAAMAYAVAQKASTGNDTYKIEMLVDYLVPKDDILEIPAG